MTETEPRHLGIDIGGTFTHVTFTGDDDDVHVDQRLTSRNPATTVRKAIAQLEAEGAFSMRDCETFSHASTIATNALIEREGAQIGLVTTDGFSDVDEMRHERRYVLYDAHIAFPADLRPDLPGGLHLPRLRRRPLRRRPGRSRGLFRPADAARNH